MSTQETNVEQAVRERYSDAAAERPEELCCPVNYDPKYLKAVPQEIIEKDYGCGDPSRYLNPGETVLDLGSGGGKICYIASQVVGPEGHVIGVDMNDDMLALARGHQQAVGDTIGHHNITFHKGKIQDLALDYDKLAVWLDQHPVTSVADLETLQARESELRKQPMIPDGSIDVIVSNCVLNLVRSQDKEALFAEMHRVLRRGGRAVISDIVCDEDVPAEMQNDPDLWSGCISGAYREDLFLEAFERAGFYGVRILEREDAPWQVVGGIEFRSMSVEATKGKEGPCLERRQSVIYRGPWKSVTDDSGLTLERGQRMAVCDKSFQIFTQAPYAGDTLGIEPPEEVPLSEAQPVDCTQTTVRTARETKGNTTRNQKPSSNCC
jgi:arsenite methyltransferase